MDVNRRIHRGRLIDLNIETARLPDGNDLELEVVRHPGGAVVAAVNQNEEVCLLRQFRHAVNQARLWELPAGRIDAADPSPIVTAKRELQEEAGVLAVEWRDLGRLLPSPGFCSECLYLYLATELTLGAPDPHEDEIIEITWVPLDKALSMAATGEIIDAKTVACLFRATWRPGE